MTSNKKHEVKCWKFGKWSWHFEKCRWCYTSAKTWNTRHKGHGLCINCFDKKRLENPKRKQQLKNQGLKFYLKNKDNLEFKKKMTEHTVNWQKTSPKHKKILKKRYLKESFKRFLTSNYKLKRWQNGIEILIGEYRVKTPIKVNGGTERELERVKSEVEIFKKVYAKVKKIKEKNIL